MPRNYTFPEEGGFWKQHGMLLTPQGVGQVTTVGVELAKMYPHLTSGRSIADLSHQIRVFSSNTSRTIMSALALLTGMVPNFPYHITHGEPCELFFESGTPGIRVAVENNDGYHDSLFHLGKSDNIAWRRVNSLASPELRDLASRTRVVNLLDKLYTMTHSRKMDPVLPAIERLLAITEYVTLVRYSRDHGVPLLSNPLLLELSPEDVALIFELAEAVYKHYFIPHSGMREQGTGRGTAGMILSEIARFFSLHRNGLRVYSAHDTTLLAIAATLGLTVPCPDFAAYFLFELYPDGRIAMKFNPSPGDVKMKNLLPILPPLEEEGFIHVDNAENGYMDEEEFHYLASSEHHSSVIRAIHRLAQLKEVPTEECGVLTEHERDKYGEIFRYYDMDDDGVLSRDELYAMFCRYEVPLTSDEIRKILDGKDGMSKEDFFCLMSILS
jgi:hypothetical protein